MAKCRIGHFMEARILEALEVDFIDESEVLTPADERVSHRQARFDVPFVCGCRDLGEALRRIAEGAALIRTKGEAGTGDIVEAVRHLRAGARADPHGSAHARPRRALAEAKALGAPLDLVAQVAREGRLPVPSFAAGGIATPADAALCMALGAEAVFVGSGIFLSETRRGARGPSWRRPRIGKTPKSSPRSAPGSGNRCAAWPRAGSQKATASRREAGERRRSS